MMPIFLAALGEGLGVWDFGGGVEHTRVLPVAGHAFALQIGDVLGEWRRGEALAIVAHDPRHDDDAPPRRFGREGERGAAAASEGRSAFDPARSDEVLPGVTGLLRGTHHLADKA